MAEEPVWRTDLAAIVLHPGEPAVWVPEGHTAESPVLSLSHDGGVWYGNAETIVRLAREAWDLDVVLLRSTAFLVDRETRAVQLSLLLQANPESMPDHGQWIAIAALSALPVGTADVDLVAAAVRELEQPLAGSRTPWYERGWFAQAMAWANQPRSY